MTSHPYITAYTDGSSSRKQGTGGWAFRILYRDQVHDRYGFAKDVTNNEMELIAVYHVLQFTKLTRHPLQILSDSQYVINSLSSWTHKWAASGWVNSMGEPVKNQHLLKPMYKLVDMHEQRRLLEFKWIEGHVGHLHNEFVDRLAHHARQTRTSNWTLTDCRVTV